MKSTVVMSLFEVGYCLVNGIHQRNEENAGKISLSHFRSLFSNKKRIIIFY